MGSDDGTKRQMRGESWLGEVMRVQPEAGLLRTCGCAHVGMSRTKSVSLIQ